MNQEADVLEVHTLLTEQTELLWNVYHAATEPPGKVNAKADLANFLFVNALHIHQMAKSALVLMENQSHYAVTLLARSALEGAFIMVASKKDHAFGPQRIAFELEELARKLQLLQERQIWPASRRPTPADCVQEADHIRRHYTAPVPATRSERDRIQRIERIAEVAGLSPYYDDDYRQLSLAVHSNQAGILNSTSGYLVRMGMLALCNATFFASQVITTAFGIKTFDQELNDHLTRMETLMHKLDFIRPSPFSKEDPAEGGASHGG
jgi:hypothetical protein